jgi:hypothetical protein
VKLPCNRCQNKNQSLAMMVLTNLKKCSKIRSGQ